MIPVPLRATLFPFTTLFRSMIAMSYIENRAVAQMGMMPTEEPSSEIVCLVDDDPLVLRSTGLLLVSDGFAVRRFNNGEALVTYAVSQSTCLPSCSTLGWKK